MTLKRKTYDDRLQQRDNIKRTKVVNQEVLCDDVWEIILSYLPFGCGARATCHRLYDIIETSKMGAKVLKITRLINSTVCRTPECIEASMLMTMSSTPRQKFVKCKGCIATNRVVQYNICRKCDAKHQNCKICQEDK